MMETETLFPLIAVNHWKHIFPNKINVFFLEINPTCISSICLHYLCMLIFSSCFLISSFSCGNQSGKNHLSLFVRAHLTKSKAALSDVQLTILIRLWFTFPFVLSIEDKISQDYYRQPFYLPKLKFFPCLSYFSCFLSVYCISASLCIQVLVLNSGSQPPDMAVTHGFHS